MSDASALGIRRILGDDPKVDDIRMSGGTCFTLNGDMMAGTRKTAACWYASATTMEAAFPAGLIEDEFHRSRDEGVRRGNAGRARQGSPWLQGMSAQCPENGGKPKAS